MKLTHAILALGFIVASCSSLKNAPADLVNLPAGKLQALGRHDLNPEKGLELISSASHFGFTFRGTSCEIYVSLGDPNSHNYLQYELDGVYQKRLKIDGKLSEPLKITAPGSGKHTVWIYKTTEAHTGPIFISKIVAPDAQALPIKKLPVIEFIGNSITCGAAADPSDVPCGSGDYHDQHNAYMAYGPRVARALGVEFVLSSVSGIGIYRNWNSDGPTMPEVYEKTDFQDWSSRSWNFQNAAPSVVSIALGTNDFSNGDGVKKRLPFDSARFVDSYVEFVKKVKVKYPQAKIALLSSAMVNGKNRDVLQNCLTAVKRQVDRNFADSAPVNLFFFKTMQARGCSGHPNVEDHAVLAQELNPFFKQLLSGKD